MLLVYKRLLCYMLLVLFFVFRTTHYGLAFIELTLENVLASFRLGLTCKVSELNSRVLALEFYFVC